MLVLCILRVIGEEGNILNTGEKIPIDGMMTTCGQLIAGLEQGTFIR